MSNKSILEQALLQVQTLEEAVKANAKGILASTMKQELNELLKESEEEEMPVDEKVSEEEVNEQPESDEEDQEDVSADDEAGDEGDLDNELTEPSDDDEVSKDIEGMDMDSDDMNMDDMGMDDEDDDTIDMTDADDEEILRVFKAMSDEDGIIVKKDGDDIELSDGDDEYIIKLDEEVSDEEEVSEEEDCQECGEMAEEEGSEEETVYEIELDEEEGMELVYELEDENSEMDDEEMEGDVDEAARTTWNPHGNKGESDHAGIKSKKTFAAGSINEEIETLRNQNSEYKKALVLFKEKLNEVAVFNANLAYATRLFTEHSTTKQEKLNILKRFDTVSTMNESKNLYKTIKTELDTKQPISESVVGKLTSAPSTSSSEVLSEAKAYENPQFKRMKDLMSKIK